MMRKPVGERMQDVAMSANDTVEQVLAEEFLDQNERLAIHLQCRTEWAHSLSS
jgi:hypothetical protein